MSYTNHPDNIHTRYARLRTQTGLDQARLEQQATKVLEQKRREDQKRFEARTAEQQAIVDKWYAEAEHWRKQVEIIYGLLEDTTRQAEARIVDLEREVKRLTKENERLRGLKRRKERE